MTVPRASLVETEHGLPCTVLGVGARRRGRPIVYPVSETAARYGASVTEETSSPAKAYEAQGEPRPGPPPDLPL